MADAGADVSTDGFAAAEAQETEADALCAFANTIAALQRKHAAAEQAAQARLEALQAAHALEVARLLAEAQAHVAALAEKQAEVELLLARREEVEQFTFEVAKGTREARAEIAALQEKNLALQGDLQTCTDRLTLIDTREDAERADVGTGDGEAWPVEAQTMTADVPLDDEGNALPLGSRTREACTQMEPWQEGSTDAALLNLDPNTLLAVTFAWEGGEIPAGVVLTPSEALALPSSIQGLLSMQPARPMRRMQIDLNALTHGLTTVPDIFAAVALPAIERNRGIVEQTIEFMRGIAPSMDQYLNPQPLGDDDDSLPDLVAHDDLPPLRLGALETPEPFSIGHAISAYMRAHRARCPIRFICATMTFDLSGFSADAMRAYAHSIEVAATVAQPGPPIVVQSTRVFGCTHDTDSMASGILGWMATARGQGEPFIRRILEPLCSDYRVFRMPDSPRWSNAMVVVCVPSL